MEAKNVRILVLGLDNAGKSSIVQEWGVFSHAYERLSEEQHMTINIDDDSEDTEDIKISNSLLPTTVNNVIEPTFGFSCKALVYKQFSVSVWDLGGQCSLRPFWCSYYDGRVAAIVWVIDMSDERLEESIKEFRRLKDTLSTPDLDSKMTLENEKKIDDDLPEDDNLEEDTINPEELNDLKLNEEAFFKDEFALVPLIVLCSKIDMLVDNPIELEEKVEMIKMETECKVLLKTSISDKQSMQQSFEVIMSMATKYRDPDYLNNEQDDKDDALRTFTTFPDNKKVFTEKENEWFAKSNWYRLPTIEGVDDVEEKKSLFLY